MQPHSLGKQGKATLFPCSYHKRLPQLANSEFEIANSVLPHYRAVPRLPKQTKPISLGRGVRQSKRFDERGFVKNMSRRPPR